MRIFLSFNSKDAALAEVIRTGLSALEPSVRIFFSPVSLGAGFWLPRLAEEIAQADAFLLLIGPKGIGPWQEVEYFTAFDRHVNDKKRFPLVPVMVAGAEAPGLSFLRTLNWVEAPVATDDRVRHRLLAALKGESAASATPLWKLVNPYRGLEAMTEANADYFHGRERETATVLRALAENPGRCPILIGASGVGKSSVAQAGVLSALRSMRWPGTDGTAANAWPRGLQNSRRWVWLTMRPADAPLDALSAAITRLWHLDARDPDHAALPRKWAKGLFFGDNTLADLIDATQEEIKKRQGEAPERIVLYLDQGEELYTRAGQKDSHRFSEVLTEGLRDKRLLAFASLRADYFDRLQSDEPLFKCHEHVNVPPLDHTQLHEVVTDPAVALGVNFEDDETANRITDAAASQPGALPLLSYLLTDMWRAMVERGDATLRLPAQAIDVGGVLARRSEEFLKDNPGEEKALRRLLTLKLAIVPPAGVPVRRQSHREECSEEEWSLAARLADHPWRLVVMGERGTDGRITAEVAHEELLRAWPRLERWLEEERTFLIFKSDAERAEKRWREEMGRADKALLTGLDLARAEELLPARSNDLSPEVVAFVQDSIITDRAAKQRQLNFQRGVAVAAIAAALLMGMIGILAWVQWGEAEKAKLSAQRALDEAAAAEAKAEGELKKAQTTQSLFLANLASQQRSKGDAGTAMLIAIEALPNATGASRPYVAEAELQLDLAWSDLHEQFVLIHGGFVQTVAFEPKRDRIVTADFDRVRLWDAETGTQVGEPIAERLLELSNDRAHFITASDDHTVRLWDVRTGKQIGQSLVGHQELVNRAWLSPDRTRLVTVSEDKTVRLWDAEAGKQVGELLDGRNVSDAAFSPDGKRIVTASENGTARLWDAETGKQLGERLTGHEGPLSNAIFSPDGRRIVTASQDGTVRLWDSATGTQIGGPRSGRVLAFSPDGQRMVTASSEKMAQLWDTETGEPIGEPITGHEASVQSAAFSPDGKTIVTTGGRSLLLWDAQTGERVDGPFVGHRHGLRTAAFSSDGERIVSGAEDGTARVWDALLVRPGGTDLAGHDKVVRAAVFSPDGKRIVTASVDGTARQWDAKTGERIGRPLTGHQGGVLSASFSPDGKRIATASWDKTVRVWDAENGTQTGEPLKGHADGILSATFSPDGKRILTASLDKTARLWDAETGQQIGEPLSGHGDFPVTGAVFSPDGRRIITIGGSLAVLWDVATRTAIDEKRGPYTGAAFSPDGKGVVLVSGMSAEVLDENGKSIRLCCHDDWITSVAFGPDGKRAVTASADKTVRSWDVETGKQVGEIAGFNGTVHTASFSPDGKRIVTASEDKATIWEIFSSIEELVSHAMAAVPRCLTSEQRRQFFLPSDPPPWCIELEKWPYHTSEWKQWLSETRAGKNPPAPR